VTEDLRAGYHAQLRTAARDTTVIAGAVGVVAFPLWILFDALVLPDGAATFLGLRLLFEGLVLSAWLGLRSPKVGGRWPEPMAFLLITLLQLGIAWMVPRVGDRLEPYVLGLSLPMYASAFLIVWRWQLTAALAGVTAVFVAVASISADPGLARTDVATTAFYLATAAAISIAGQVYRQHLGWQQYVTNAELEEERRRNQTLVEELDQLSREDPLTAVGNRRAWEERLYGEFLRSRRSGRPMAVLVADVDRFKVINDTHGHETGDGVLRSVAALLSERVRATDFVARLGGDEFGIVLPDTTGDAAAHVALDLSVRTRAMGACTLSFGVASLEPGDPGPADLLRRADAALYDAKTTRDCVKVAATTAPSGS
jgi:diguanylate cyclase (GGDEF)-like protein